MKTRVYQDMRERLQEYKSAQDSSITMPINSLHVQWEPPSWTFFKVNYDRALFHEIQQAGIVLVIRDSGGQIVRALLESITLPATVDNVEALACCKAISFALEMGLDKVVFEGDSNNYKRCQFGLTLLSIVWPHCWWCKSPCYEFCSLIFLPCKTKRECCSW